MASCRGGVWNATFLVGNCTRDRAGRDDDRGRRADRHGVGGRGLDASESRGLLKEARGVEAVAEREAVRAQAAPLVVGAAPGEQARQPQGRAEEGDSSPE